MAEELKRSVPGITIELIRSSGGAFEIMQDAKPIFSKLRQGRFPESSEIIVLLKT